jgi:hypothetical protein
VFLLQWFLIALPIILGANILLDGFFEAAFFDSRRRPGFRAKWWIETDSDSNPFKRLGIRIGERYGMSKRVAVAGTEIFIGLVLVGLGLLVALWAIPKG